jgi:hypothetical protein
MVKRHQANSNRFSFTLDLATNTIIVIGKPFIMPVAYRLKSQPERSVPIRPPLNFHPSQGTSANLSTPQTRDVSGEFFILMERSAAFRRLFVEADLFLVHLPTGLLVSEVKHERPNDSYHIGCRAHVVCDGDACRCRRHHHP